MNRKDIFMSGFKSKLTYPFNHKDLSEFETIVNFYEEQIKKYKEVINKIKFICDKVPNDWTLCGIDILHNIENILKEVEHE